MLYSEKKAKKRRKKKVTSHRPWVSKQLDPHKFLLFSLGVYLHFCHTLWGFENIQKWFLLFFGKEISGILLWVNCMYVCVCVSCYCLCVYLSPICAYKRRNIVQKVLANFRRLLPLSRQDMQGHVCSMYHNNKSLYYR